MKRGVKKEQLTVAMVGHKHIPSREGGVEIVVEQLSTRMVELGHAVTCYNRSGSHVCGNEYRTEKCREYKGVRLRKVLTVNRRGLAAVTSSVFGALRAACGRYDVVHFHAEGPAFMCWLPKLFGKRIIVTVHGLDWQRAKWGRFASTYIMCGEKSAVKWADEIIVLSEGVQQYFADTYNRSTRFIPNGVERPQLHEAQLIREQFGLEKDSYILYLGRLVPEKGLVGLVEAYKRVKTDKRLVIAGGASDSDAFAEELKTLAQEDERILFTGFVQGQLLEELYSNAYIYTLPSNLEGMPLSLLEAMSYDNCCLVSDIAECAEVVEDKAVTFRKGDVSDLADKLQYLCDTPSAVEGYKRAAAAHVCSKYSWDEVVDRTVSLYRADREAADVAAVHNG